MKIFRSKIGLELLAPALLFMSLLTFWTIKDSNWTGLLIVILTILFLAYLFASTIYKIEGDKLEIKCGIFIDKYVDIQNIKKVKSATDFFAAPATSVKRLVITFNETESIAISPKDKTGFIKTLLDINPRIELS